MKGGFQIACLARVVAGHGQLTFPSSRSGSNLDTAGGCPNLGTSNGHDYCAWHINGVTIPGVATIPDDMLTSAGQSPANNPWFAPGSTPLSDPWGEYTCGKIEGKDGRLYPATKRMQVQSGGVMEIGWALNANHGGGTSVRLCPSDSDLSESCFQRTVLSATRNISWIQDGSDTHSRREIQARRTRVGTFPIGSEWTMNPIPDREEFFTPPLGLFGHGPFAWNIIDEYQIPRLTPGDYTLSWRWDCEESPQIWTNCADITIVDGPFPTPFPTPVPSPVPPAPSPQDRCEVLPENRQDCGHTGTQESDCEASGCCWTPAGEGSSVPWCYHPKGNVLI